MESTGPPTIPRRLLDVLRTIFFMLRNGISKRKLMLDLRLLLHRGKLAGKTVANLLSHHHYHHHHSSSTNIAGGGRYSGFSCGFVDPNTSFYEPREIEFSCSNTPAIATATKRKNRRHLNKEYRNYDAAAIAKVFEFLNQVPDTESAIASPSPAPIWSFGRSPAPVRQLRITDSPFPIREEEEVEDGTVDKEADEFIKRFYEQLRRQPVATPENGCHHRAAPLVGRA